MTTYGGFFGAASLAPAIDPNAESIDLFAQAIAGRFNNSDKALLTARLSPTQAPSPSMPIHTSSPQPSPAAPLARMSIGRPSPPHEPTVASSSASTSDFTMATASTLSEILRTPHVLVLDIRPHSAYSVARLPHAISLSVPSTLLKRPAFTLQKLAAMLPSAAARSRFRSWSKASRILVYDADSSTLADGSNLLGLLRKFRAAGFSGDVAWLQGGIQSLWRDNRHLVEENSLSDDEEDVEAPQVLRTRNLPQAAFRQSTTIIRSSPNSVNVPADSPTQVPQSTQSTSGSFVRLTAANPFYDNIRQNMELSHGITERIPLRLSPTIVSRAKELPFAWLRNIVACAGQDEGTEALAKQFYRIELDEQRRMQGIMAHHSMQSGATEILKADEAANEVKQDGELFPFSIVAGVEKGTKNRYRNIWPFEHSRVRLRTQEYDDYVNASFVRPLGTRRKFIATQGPLPSTFSDFWSVVWEQDVHLILMLTKEYEGGSVKCAKYWADGQYGPCRLKCISTSGAEEEEDPGGSGIEGSGGVFFNAPPREESNTSPAEDKDNNFTIRRVFELSHSAHPELKPRTVTQLQYLGWPDMDVPVKPRSLLRLMFEVDDLIDRGPSRNGLSGNSSPVLLHCSAGVGRTGAFIMINAVLDGVRREIRKRVMSKKGMLLSGGASENGSSGSDGEAQSDSDNAMDVDSTSSVRNRSVMSSIPTSTSVLSVPSKSTTVPPTPQPLSTAKDSGTPLVTQTQTGPVVTLQMGGNKSGRPDIHIPLVPSNDVPAQRHARPSSTSPSVGNLNSPPSPMNLLFRRRLSRQFVHRPLTPDFTIADADSMFMSPGPNPAFAMDVEPIQAQSQQASNNNSSSGEGNASSGDRVSGSVSSGSASDGRFTGSLRTAFANMSSADDIPGSTERFESVHFRSRFGSGGSGEGAGGSASESSAKCSNASGGNGGGYSSASSLGLSSFAGMAVTSPVPSPGYSSPVSPRPSVPLASRPQHRSPRKLPMQKTSLLAPKPLHLTPSMPELTEDVETTIQSTSCSLPSLKETHGSNALVRSNTSSSSSTISSSTDTHSSLRSSVSSGHTTETNDTPLSTHRPSRSPSAEKESGKVHDQNVFDYLSPRLLHGDDSPPLLSSLEEPLRQILEDMREQRMSLCQSLRQYVFVHNAIIEGALIIADEERKRLGLEGFESFDLDSPLHSTGSPRIQMTGKRGASPTELTKKDMKGEVALAKRPSVKRGKSTSSGESANST